MIVLGTTAHLDELANLFDQYRIFYKKDSDMDAAKKFLSARIENKESIIFIYYDQDQAVGFTQLYPTYSSVRMVQNWILNDLYVLESARKKGVATKLIDQAIGFAISKGSQYVQLETQVDNTHAQHLYEHLGFEKQGLNGEFFLYRKFL